jgi:hypothetical protein
VSVCAKNSGARDRRITSTRQEAKRKKGKELKAPIWNSKHARMQKLMNKETQTKQHFTAQPQKLTKLETNMTNQGKQARNKAPLHATQTETLQCGTSAEACCAPRIQPEPVRAVWRPAAAVSIRDK